MVLYIVSSDILFIYSREGVMSQYYALTCFWYLHPHIYICTPYRPFTEAQNKNHCRELIRGPCSLSIKMTHQNRTKRHFGICCVATTKEDNPLRLRMQLLRLVLSWSFFHLQGNLRTRLSSIEYCKATWVRGQWYNAHKHNINLFSLCLVAGRFGMRLIAPRRSLLGSRAVRI